MATTHPSGFIFSNGFYYPPYPREQVLNMLEFKKTGFALDIGAGFGNNTVPLLKSGFKVIATETNPECVAALEQLAKEHPKMLEVIPLRLEELDFKLDTFDAVICTMVLHFLNPTNALMAVNHIQDWTKIRE